MRKNKRQRKVQLYLLIVLGLTIGFALLSTTLYINGTAGINKNTWDIHWNEESIVETQGSVTATTPAEVIDTEKKNVSFEVELELPGDFYEFTVDAKNYGTIDGEISNIEKNYYKQGETTPSTPPSYIIFSVTYDDGTIPKPGDVLKAGNSQKYKVRVEYDSELEELPENPIPSGKFEFKLDEKQHVTDCVTSYKQGDIVYFDPVNYRMCEAEESDTCYKWITVGKNNNIYELYLLTPLSNMSWSTTNPVDVIKSSTASWSNKLTMDDSYDVDVNENYGYHFSETKGRVITKNDWDNLSTENQEIIKDSCGMRTNVTCVMFDTTNQLVGQINPGGAYTMFPYSANAGGTTLGPNNDVRPVIKVDFSDIGNNITCEDKNNPVYTAGDLVYFDPVSTNKCDSTTFDLTAINNGTSTCYKWRVIETNDREKKTKVNIQLDHNLSDGNMNNDEYYWVIKDDYIAVGGSEEDWNESYGKHNSKQGPVTALKKLEELTSTWGRVPLLNYEYDSTNKMCRYGYDSTTGTCKESYETMTTGESYGKLTCINGVCVNGNNNTITTNIRVRMITGEELNSITRMYKPRTAWSKNSDKYNEYYYFSNDEFEIGTHNAGYGNTTLSWLIENTYGGPNSHSGSTSNVYTTNYKYPYGYWTMTPNSSDDTSAWAIQADGKFWGEGEITDNGYYGIRPVINIEKSKITKE